MAHHRGNDSRPIWLVIPFGLAGWILTVVLFLRLLDPSPASLAPPLSTEMLASSPQIQSGNPEAPAASTPSATPSPMGWFATDPRQPIDAVAWPPPHTVTQGPYVGPLPPSIDKLN